MKRVMFVGVLGLGAFGSTVVAADEIAPARSPRWYASAGLGPFVGSQRYYNSGGPAAQVRGGLRGAGTLGVEALFSVARLSGGEGRSWADPFEVRATMLSVRAGPRWHLALGQQHEISVALHAGGTSAAGRLGVAVDLSAAVEHRLSGRVRVGFFASGMRAANGSDGHGSGWYVDGGPLVRVFLDP